MSGYRTLTRSLRKNGVVGTWTKAIRHLSASVRAASYRRQIARGRLDAKGIFTLIYQKRIWDECDRPGASISGYGSSVAYTENIRRILADILRKFDVKVIFDAPCGDFNWMRLVDFPAGTEYIGADIVDELIRNNLARYGRKGRRFLVFDIVNDRFPNADLWFCRDCLFHLSYRDILGALSGFVRSGIPYVLTTTHINGDPHGSDSFANRDIATGDWRRIDLCAGPFYLPAEVEYEFIDFVAPEPPRKMCLWTRAQIAAALPNLVAAMSSPVTLERC